MPLYSIPNRDVRDACRRRLEMLEIWLRRLVDEEFREKFGADILDAVNTAGTPLVKNEIRIKIRERMASRPGRYGRSVDAALLDELIAIICKRPNFEAMFKMPLSTAFPHGADEAKTFLERLVGPRNHLAHANPLSTRQAEQVICYTGDVVESIKIYYISRGGEKEMRAPFITKMRDAFGNEGNFQGKITSGRTFDFTKDPRFILHRGEAHWLEMEVDPSFEDNEYDIVWHLGGRIIKDKRHRLEFIADNNHVAASSRVSVQVISKQAWHRFQGVPPHDDLWCFVYCINP